MLLIENAVIIEFLELSWYLYSILNSYLEKDGRSDGRNGEGIFYGAVQW